MRRAIHLAIRQASNDVGQHHKFNTAIAQVMTLMNVLEKAPAESAADRALLQEGLETVALLLARVRWLRTLENRLLAAGAEALRLRLERREN